MLILIMLLTFTACGNKTSSDSNSASGGNESTTSDKVDVSTLNGFLLQFGLTEDDLKPTEYFTSFEYEVTEGKEYQGIVKANMAWTGDANQKSVMSAWVHQIYDRTVAISDDGKAYIPYSTEVFTLDSGELPGGGLSTQWAWLYKGTSYWLTIGAEGGSFAYLEISFN